jgi:hypothetical protein
VHRRRWLVVVGIVVAVVAAALATFAYLWTHSGARPVSVDEARRRFRSDTADADAAARFTPAEGVYAYTGSGSESLSSPPKSQGEGPGMPGTVIHVGRDCWKLRLDYSSNHWREWKFCVRDDALTEVANRVFQRWDFVVSTIENHTVMTCAPPSVVLVADPRPGSVWPASCSGTNSQISGLTVSSGTHRYVGREPVTVGTASVDAFHFRDERTVSGAQSGTETFDFWLAADGLPLKGRQRIQVDSDSPIGQVTYTQEGEFSLVRRSPRT